MALTTLVSPKCLISFGMLEDQPRDQISCASSRLDLAADFPASRTTNLSANDVKKRCSANFASLSAKLFIVRLEQNLAYVWLPCFLYRWMDGTLCHSASDMSLVGFDSLRDADAPIPFQDMSILLQMLLTFFR